MVNFDILEKGFKIVSSPHFHFDFSRKIVYCVLLTDQISLSDCLLFLEIFGKICIAIVCFADCDVINVEINLFQHNQRVKGKS